MATNCAACCTPLVCKRDGLCLRTRPRQVVEFYTMQQLYIKNEQEISSVIHEVYEETGVLPIKHVEM